MSETTILTERFTATYNRKITNGVEAGFLGSDSHSGGYPYFTDAPDAHYLRDSLVKALDDVHTIKADMKTYFGHENVDFDSVQVVCYRTTIESIDDIVAVTQTELVKSAKAKLTNAELAALFPEHVKE